MSYKFKTDVVQAGMKFIIGFVFFVTKDPVLLLASFFFLVGIFISGYIGIENQVMKSIDTGKPRTSAQKIISTLGQLLFLFFIVALIWILLYKKIDVIKSIL